MVLDRTQSRAQTPASAPIVVIYRWDAPRGSQGTITIGPMYGSTPPGLIVENNGMPILTASSPGQARETSSWACKARTPTPSR